MDTLTMVILGFVAGLAIISTLLMLRMRSELDKLRTKVALMEIGQNAVIVNSENLRRQLGEEGERLFQAVNPRHRLNSHDPASA